MSLTAARGTQEVAMRIGRMLAQAPHEVPRLQPLVLAPAPARCVAVDGSHVVLAEAGGHLLGAFRAGSVGVEQGSAMTPRILTPEVVLLPKDARAVFAQRLEQEGYAAEGIPRMDAKAALDALRTLEEARAALVALETLGAGDVLLIDGALQVRPNAPLLERVLAQAAARKVEVIGVCKSTSLTLGAAPALAACQLAARTFATRTWYAPLSTPAQVRGASFAARLSPAEERVFRFDILSGDPAALSALASLCGHPAYPGYPSPLAMAHNAVLLNDDTRRRLLAHVQEAAIAAGADPRAWEAAFVDYHDILELGA